MSRSASLKVAGLTARWIVLPVVFLCSVLSIGYFMLEERSGADARVPTVELLLDDDRLRWFIVEPTRLAPLESDLSEGVANFEYRLAEALCAEDFFKRIAGQLGPKPWVVRSLTTSVTEYSYNTGEGGWAAHMTVRVSLDEANHIVTVSKR